MKIIFWDLTSCSGVLIFQITRVTCQKTLIFMKLGVLLEARIGLWFSIFPVMTGSVW